MKKNLLKSMIALAAFCLGGISAYAQNQVGTASVKMTYINGSDDNVDVAYGEIPVGEPAYAGYNKITGGKVELANKGWGVNNVAFLKVDASSIPGVIQKATLVADFQQIAARGMNYGVGYNDSEWSPELTWNTADRSITAIEGTGTQSTAKATDDVELSFDITGALSIDKNYTTTLLVYNLAAAAGYIKNPKVVVEYEPFEATTTKFDFEDGVNIFSDKSRITSSIADDDVLKSKVTLFTAAGNCQNGYGFSKYDFTSLLNTPALVAVEFDYYNEAGPRAILTLGDALVRGDDGGCAKNTYGSKGAIFRIGSDKNNFFINGINLPQADKETTENVIDPETGEPKTDPETGDIVTVTTKTIGFCNKWLHVSVIANNDAKTIAWVVTDMEGNVLHQGSDAYWQADANELSQIDVFAWINNSMSGKIDNLKITNYKSNAVFADYTIKYVDANGKEIKDARKGNGQVGKFVTLLDSDKAPITADVEEGGINGKQKYLYDSDDSETVAIADGNTAVITVKFREAEIYYAALTIKSTDGVALKTMRGDSMCFFEGDSYTVYLPMTINFNGAYYSTPPTVADSKGNLYNGDNFKFPGALSKVKNPQDGRWYYMNTINTYEKKDSIAYYADFEYLALPVNEGGLGLLEGTVNSWYSYSGGYFDRFSQGRGIRLDAGSYVYTEPIAEAAAYKVSIYGRNDLYRQSTGANQPNPYALGIRDAEGNVTILDVAVPDWASALTGYNIVENVMIPAGASLVIKNIGSTAEINGTAYENQISLDDISLTKTGEYKIPTGIKNVEKIQNAGIIYNLNGQVVKATKKGLYIQNGKKFVVK